MLKPEDYRYFSFQIWQEGLARYTEYKFLELPEGYVPSKEILKLDGFVSFRGYREQFHAEQVGRISMWGLNDHRRDCFYALGLGEGVLLDKLDPDWRRKYLTEKFFVERYSNRF